MAGGVIVNVENVYKPFTYVVELSSRDEGGP
jgi:hypothetical protein